MNKPSVCIIGSINMDMTVTTDKMPEQGETVLGNRFFTNPGGKGANQAVAAARMGATVHFIGAIGNDSIGETLLENFRNESIHTKGIETVSNESTGTATIILSENDNRIIVASGANNHVTPELVAKHADLIKTSDIVLLQLEIPMKTIEFTMDVATSNGVPVILNPAPFQILPEKVQEHATYMTPNEIEHASIEKGPLIDDLQKKLIVTRGEQGVSFNEEGFCKKNPGHMMEVRDTTGAGDTFNGALAAELAAGAEMNEAIKLANAAAALSVTKIGAQSGMPIKQDVQEFLRKKEFSQ